MIQNLRKNSLFSTVRKSTYALALLASTCAYAQLYSFSKQDLIDFTKDSPFERFADGRPKVPDSLIERARDLSSEEVWSGLEDHKGFRNQ